MILTAQQSDTSLAALDVNFVSGKTQENTMQDAGLEALRAGVPAARALPLLAALAGGKPARIRLAYFDNHLEVGVTPC